MFANIPAPRRIRAMNHGTTTPAHMRNELFRPPHESSAQGPDMGRLSVEVEGQRFRVRTPQLATQWLPDTPGNRHMTVVWFRLLVDDQGKPLCTLQDLASIVGSPNRQAASQHLEDFRQCGEDFRAFVLRKRKVDATVVEAVLAELLHTPLAGPTELVPRVQARLDRHDLSVANIESALEQISCVPVLRVLRRQLETGHVQYHEAWLLTELLENLARPAMPPAGWSMPTVDRGMRLADPTPLAALVPTELPVLAALLPSRGQWACRWVGRQLRQLKKVPKVLITDGLQAYAYLVPGAKHVLCRFHHQQGVTHWLKQHFATEAEIDARKPAMKRLFQTHDKRTVRRRLARLKERAAEWGITLWVSTVEAKLPQLICSVGSVRLPSTSNAVERFFRAFQRFYCTRGGFHSLLSAKRELLLFLVVYVFTQHTNTGQSPIEVIVPDARSMPLYRLINDPFRALQERADVKPEAPMADLLRPQELGTLAWLLIRERPAPRGRGEEEIDALLI